MTETLEIVEKEPALVPDRLIGHLHRQGLIQRRLIVAIADKKGHRLVELRQNFVGTRIVGFVFAIGLITEILDHQIGQARRLKLGPADAAVAVAIEKAQLGPQLQGDVAAACQLVAAEELVVVDVEAVEPAQRAIHSLFENGGVEAGVIKTDQADAGDLLRQLAGDLQGDIGAFAVADQMNPRLGILLMQPADRRLAVFDQIGQRLIGKGLDRLRLNDFRMPGGLTMHQIAALVVAQHAEPPHHQGIAEKFEKRIGLPIRRGRSQILVHVLRTRAVQQHNPVLDLPGFDSVGPGQPGRQGQLPVAHKAVGLFTGLRGQSQQSCQNQRQISHRHPSSYAVFFEVNSSRDKIKVSASCYHTYMNASIALTTPAAFLEWLNQVLAAQGPSGELIDQVLEACLRWPDQTALSHELLVLLQETPPEPLPRLSHLGQWLATELPRSGSDIQPYASWLSLCLRQSPAWEELAQASRERAPARLPALFQEPLFALLLLCTFQVDAELEATLCCFRGQLLASATLLGPEWESPLLMLALQAHNNGFVWAESEAESRALEQLPERRADMLGLLLLACYRPLQLGEGALAQLQQRSPLWQRLIRVCHTIPAEEALLAAGLPNLTPTARDTDCQAFYEAAPYPPWLAPERLAVEALSEQLQALFPRIDWSRRLAPGMDILVAGCGTGQQLAQLALQRPDARLTGLDLSRASLGYAARMLREHQLQAELYQADLLQLTHWQRRFDLIACGGVLQHLSDPQAGLQHLARLLKPGGLLKLGVYSRRAREPVQRLRHRLGLHGGESAGQTRALRQPLLTDPSPDAGWLRRTRDFYHLGTCQDLLCHPSEQSFDLPQLAPWFNRLQLRVLGLELWNPQHYFLYRQRFPEDPEMTDLQNWDRLEAAIPWLFAGLMVIWLEAAG